jgi:hypothetical protein
MLFGNPIQNSGFFGKLPKLLVQDTQRAPSAQNPARSREQAFSTTLSPEQAIMTKSSSSSALEVCNFELEVESE